MRNCCFSLVTLLLVLCSVDYAHAADTEKIINKLVKERLGTVSGAKVTELESMLEKLDEVLKEAGGEGASLSDLLGRDVPETDTSAVYIEKLLSKVFEADQIESSVRAKIVYLLTTIEGLLRSIGGNGDGKDGVKLQSFLAQKVSA